MDCSTCGRHFPLSLKNRYEKHLYLCKKFEEHIQIIDHGLLVCRICDNDYETQEKIFWHISQAHFNTEKAAKKAKKRTIVTFRKNRHANFKPNRSFPEWNSLKVDLPKFRPRKIDLQYIEAETLEAVRSGTEK